MNKFYRACKLVLSLCPNGYAKAYAKQGLSLQEGDEVETQALYILSNIDHWKGHVANEVKLTLKQISKGIYS